MKSRFGLSAVFIVLLGAASLPDAGPALGVSTSLGPVWLLGGRLSYVPEVMFRNCGFVPYAVLGVSFTPIPKKRLFCLSQSEYLQLRERRIFTTLGVGGRIVSRSYPLGLDAELSLGLFNGWYRGSEKDFKEEITPVAAVGPIFHWEGAGIITRYQWYRIHAKNGHSCSLILEYAF